MLLDLYPDTEFIGKKVIHFEKTDSTNSKAKVFIESLGHGDVIIADTQTQGSGRLGREWHSPKGGVWLSIVLKPSFSVSKARKVILATAVSVAESLRILYNIEAKIRWPNDVLVDGKKVCGILIDSSISKGKVEWIIIGIGINANISLPEELREKGTTLKEILGREILNRELIEILLEMFERVYHLLENEEIKVIEKWKEISDTIGKEVRITTISGTVEGTAIDIDNDCSLMIKLRDGEIKKVNEGDCIYLE